MAAATLRVLEFYSGVGGMRYALELTGISVTVVEAFDINELANDVYEYNFGHRPSQGNIQRLTEQKLDKYMADVWLLSPPCQPYTRQGLQKDLEDPRAWSFLKLLEMLPLMSRPPTCLFMENVVGFEWSFTHDRLLKVLEAAGFLIQEFILTPLQFGIPYSRPRYFCLAKRLPHCFLYPQFNNSLLCELGPLVFCHPKAILDKQQGKDRQQGNPEKVLQAQNLHEPKIDPHASCNSIFNYLVPEMQPSKLAQYMVPDAVIDQWGDVFDVVTPNSKRCCCFTKSYGRFVKGTGSLLATKGLAEGNAREFTKLHSDPDKDKAELKDLKLRYFTPREIANLHSFPKEFIFPDHISLKQR